MNMMTNLFESFDPMINYYLALNWIMMIFCVIMIFNYYWLIPSRILMFWMSLIKFIFMEFSLLIGNKKYQSNLLIFISLLIYILLLNLFGLMPYVFTVTSHMSFNLILSLPMWFSFIFFGCKSNPLKVLMHLVPKNTPVFLMNFMVLIEFISNVIRPFTLAIRLTANLIAGHLLLILLGSFMMKMNIILVILFILIQNILLVLELSMSFIQAYVFSILSVLYFTEFK